MNSPAERIPEIFAEALEIDSAAERAAFVEKACAGDQALLDAVERLLARHDEAEDFFKEGSPTQMSAAEITRALLDSPDWFTHNDSALPDDNEVGTQIDNYKLLQKIGEGGVGNVYLAEEIKPVRRKVALKVIKAGMDTRSVIARFEAERQALAMMEHPNIASVLNAGETESGRPYFVMELVHGERITTYCDENELPVRQRLDLFIQVCHAIQHAHQKGVIHRDIKPSNVLVRTQSGTPSPVVIDFGIAKATGESLLTDKTINTLMGPIIGTPAYMSPEQTNLKQVDIDTRSDIYSLGVLLYELLVSRPPFDHEELLSSSLDELCRILREKEPPSPSARFRLMDPGEQAKIAKKRGMEPRRLAAMLTDELGWIVMKALEKERERRYESAGELAADVQRFLDNEPVLARPPSGFYLFKKLVLRNMAVSISVAVITLTLIAFLATSSWLYLREHKALKRAVAAERREQQLRMDAEDRERITQAAFLISQGKLQEADQVVEKVSIVTPSLEVESVLRTLGEWHALQGQWPKSAARFSLLLKADIKDNSWAITDDLLKAGPVLIEQGDVLGYEDFRQAAIAMYADTTECAFAERTLKVSLLLPVDQATLNELQSIENVLTKACKDVPVVDGMTAWGTMSLALLKYREGEWQAAIDWSAQCLSSIDRHPVRIAITRFVQSMATYKVGHFSDAQSYLQQGRMPLETAFSQPLEIGSMQDGFWYDWIYARILMREAESLLGSSSPGGN